MPRDLNIVLQGGDGGGLIDISGLVDAVIKALEKAFEKLLVEPFYDVISSILGEVVKFFVHAPAPHPPDGYLFGRPTNEYWGGIYDFYWNEAVPAGFIILFVSFFVRQAAVTWGLTSVDKSRGMKKNLVNGMLMIPMGWYLCVILLRFGQALTQYFAPSAAELEGILGGLFGAGFLSGGILVLFGGTISLSLFFLGILINMARILFVIMIVAALPVLVGFTYGQVPILSNLGEKMYTKLPILALMTLPTAIGFQVMVLMFDSSGDIINVFGGEIVGPLFALAPAALGILGPIAIYNMQLYNMGGVAAARAFGATPSSPVQGMSAKSATNAPERAKDFKEKWQGRAKDAYDERFEGRTHFGTEIGDEADNVGDVRDKKHRTAKNIDEDFDWGKYGGEGVSETDDIPPYEPSSSHSDSSNAGPQALTGGGTGKPDVARGQGPPSGDSGVDVDTDWEPESLEGARAEEQELYQSLEDPEQNVGFIESVEGRDDDEVAEILSEHLSDEHGRSPDKVWVEQEERLIDLNEVTSDSGGGRDSSRVDSGFDGFNQYTSDPTEDMDAEEYDRGYDPYGDTQYSDSGSG